MMNVDNPIASINTSTYTNTNTNTSTNISTNTNTITNINTNVEEAIILSDDPLSVDEDEDIPNSSMESAFSTNTNPNTSNNTSFSLCDFCDEFFDSDKPHNCQDLEYVMG